MADAGNKFLASLNTRYEVLKGTLMWCRVTTPDEYGWKVTLYPDNDSYLKILELQKEGLKNHLRKDEDGYNMDFRRPNTRRMRNRDVVFQAPEVVLADGRIHEGPIGNGSTGAIKIEVYKYDNSKAKGVASRLAAIKLDKLVPYEPPKERPSAAVGGWE